MGVWIHRMIDKGVCAFCGPVRVTYKGSCFNAAKRFKPRPVVDRKIRPVGEGRLSISRSRHSSCDRCGFIPEYVGQLDTDHINENHNDNRKHNLQTLCDNCHRYKTWLARKPAPILVWD